ncbi:hypothetical protein WJX81_002146 [Elliptochloris bilobata]|uniref:Aminotransferase class V domain-containing protein n=1 Tax=Elliptochloris bilobata TaxID=381761 RepID=A0AAW1S9X3_9CHLO
MCDTARAQFAYFDPASGNLAFMENAGGSQVPTCVADAVRDHLLYNCAQLGAGYAVSNRSDAAVVGAHEVVRALFNAHGAGEVALGACTSQLFAAVADAYRRVGAIGPGDEIIVQEACHEANASPWVRLAADTGATLVWWRFREGPAAESALADLAQLLTPRTRLVAAVHVSNILGAVLDAAQLVQTVRGGPRGARTRVALDGVAFAPHLPVDVAAWGVDWYAVSLYKICGPHMAALFGTHTAFAEVAEGGPNHYFVHASAVPYKWELGGPSHEACAGVAALPRYLAAVAGEEAPPVPVEHKRAPQAAGALGVQQQRLRATIEAAFARFVLMEQPLQEKLLAYLATKPQVTVIGPPTAQPGERVPVVSFRHSTQRSADIAKKLQERGFALRNGHNYAHRLLTRLAEAGAWAGGAEDGVVRVSLLHYNTPGEVAALIDAMEAVL